MTLLTYWWIKHHIAMQCFLKFTFNRLAYCRGTFTKAWTTFSTIGLHQNFNQTMHIWMKLKKLLTKPTFGWRLKMWYDPHSSCLEISLCTVFTLRVLLIQSRFKQGSVSQFLTWELHSSPSYFCTIF